MEYALTDIEVRRVMSSLRSMKLLTLEEIVEEYQKMYPPSLPPMLKKGRVSVLERIYEFLMQRKNPPLPPVSPSFIRDIMKFLETSRLVRSEVFTFYEEPIPPTKKYTLTTAGIQAVFGRR
jgi:hypothetical protein